MAREPLSRGDVLLLVAVLAVFGIADAALLTLEYYEIVGSNVCDFSALFSCTAVRTSPYSAVAGIPLAVVGLGGFVLLFALAALAFRGVESVGPWSVDRWLLAFALLGALIGLGLTFVEIFLIGAICVLCAIGFALDLAILAAAWRLDRGGSREPAEATA